MTEAGKKVATFVAAAFIAAGVFTVAAQSPAPAPGPSRLPLAPTGRSGNMINPALEGWWKNADGTTTFLLGYYNRNEAATEIPIGPNNRIEPGGPDMGQPMVFLRGRQYGMFTITVPKDFGSKRLTWTLTANGQTLSIPIWINEPYAVDPFKNAASGNTPPRVKFDPNGPEHVAGPRGIAKTYDGSVNSPVTLTLWATDAVDPSGEHPPEPVGRGRGLRVSWSSVRGPGDVTFDPQSQNLPEAGGEATAKATFKAPGSYMLRAQINDASGEGGGGDQCCWTSAHVAVQIK